MLIDTHAHVQFSAFDGEREEVIGRAFAAGLQVINVGTQLDTSRAAVELARQHPGNFAVIGLHPVHTYSQHIDEEESHFRTREERFDPKSYGQLAADPLVVGIGECGLDYYRLPEDADREAIKHVQREAFISQIRLAKELNKALVIHCRPSQGSMDAYEDILSILDSEGADSVRFDIHSFTGSPAVAGEFLDRGAYVGLNGIITFDKTGNMAEVVKAVPLERIVLETDCPYLSPLPHRGKKNEPLFVRFVAEKAAELKGLTIAEIEEASTLNARKLFAL